MQAALNQQKAWAPGAEHTLVVVLTTVVAVLVVIALLVVTGLVVQDLTGGASVAPLVPEPGLDL
jgi:predicted anti-sigma-YlaC factor YlaD